MGQTTFDSPFQQIIFSQYGKKEENNPIVVMATQCSEYIVIHVLCMSMCAGF